MSIDKKEPNREGSEDSMELNSPTPEAETGAPQENTAQQKRKGGRKPVGLVLLRTKSCMTDEHYRSMLLPRNASNGIARPRLHLESAVLSTSSNLRKLSECMRRICITCRLLIGVLQMNASC
jgi:hypothetical protein